MNNNRHACETDRGTELKTASVFHYSELNQIYTVGKNRTVLEVCITPIHVDVKWRSYIYQTVQFLFRVRLMYRISVYLNIFAQF